MTAVADHRKVFSLRGIALEHLPDTAVQRVHEPASAWDIAGLTAGGSTSMLKNRIAEAVFGRRLSQRR